MIVITGVHRRSSRGKAICQDTPSDQERLEGGASSPWQCSLRRRIPGIVGASARNCQLLPLNLHGRESSKERSSGGFPGIPARIAAENTGQVAESCDEHWSATPN